MSDFEITVPVKDTTGLLTLRQHVGEGQFGEFKVELATTIPESSPYVAIGGRNYTVNIHDIVKAVAEKAVENDNLTTE